jgi:hypothetical protein
MSSLSDVSICIKTFLRDSKLYKTISDIRRTMSEAQLLIADDGEMTEEKDLIYAELIREGHKVFILPFDSGFGKKANKIIDNLDRPYTLVGSDDFDFAPPSVRVGVQKAVVVLDQNSELDIASGRLTNRGPYEFELIDKGDEIIERPIDTNFHEYAHSIGLTDYIPCDVTVNYSLIRSDVFQKVRFDEEEIIGEGGHGTFFLDCKRTGINVGWVPSFEISEQTGNDDERYKQFRRRACGLSRACFKKRGIKRWTLGSGQVDYEEK